MSIIATALKHLIAAGVSGDDLVRAVAEMEAAMSAPIDAVAERRRAYDRERKRKAKANSTGIPPESAETVETAENPSLSRPPLSSPHTPQQTPPTHTHPEIQTRARKGHRLPSGWEPKPLTGDTAKAVAAWPPGALERELARFRDWAASATGRNATKSNWDAAWRNWIRKAEDDGRYRRNDRTTASNDEIQNPYVRAALERQAERTAAQRRQPDGWTEHGEPAPGFC